MTNNQTNKENMELNNTFSPMKIHRKPKKNKTNVLKEMYVPKEEEVKTFLNEEELNELFGKLKDAEEPRRDFREM